MMQRTVWATGVNVLELVCECGCPGRAHRPSGLGAYGRGLCRDIRCTCPMFTPDGIPEIEWPWPAYPWPTGPKAYRLVVHQRVLFGDAYEYASPVESPLPPVSQATFDLLAHGAIDDEAPADGDVRYADFPGGPMHRVGPFGVAVNRCGCGVQMTRAFHHFDRDDGEDAIRELTQVLAWVNANVPGDDWCELVPVPLELVLPVPVQVLTAARAVVGYCLPSERSDYMEQDDEGRAGHVYPRLMELDGWLNQVWPESA